MKTLKIVLYTLFTFTIIYSITVIGVFAGVTLTNGSVTGVASPAYGTSTGNLIIAYPEPVTKIQENEYILNAGTITSIGSLMNVTPVDDYYLVQVQTGPSEAEINNYTVSSNVQKITAQIPVIGFLPGLLQKTWVGGFVLTLFLTIASIILIKGFYKKKPQPVVVNENQIKILQNFFDNAPEPPTKEDIKEYERKLKNA